MIIRNAFITNSSSTSFIAYGIILDRNQIGFVARDGDLLPDSEMWDDTPVCKFAEAYSADSWYPSPNDKAKVGIYTDYNCSDSLCIIYGKGSRQEFDSYGYIDRMSIEDEERWREEIIAFCAEHKIPLRDEGFGWVAMADGDHHF
jgi:hypothetical protein